MAVFLLQDNSGVMQYTVSHPARLVPPSILHIHHGQSMTRSGSMMSLATCQWLYWRNYLFRLSKLYWMDVFRKFSFCNYRRMCMVSYQRIAMAIVLASKVAVFFHCRCCAWFPGSHGGNTEQVAAQWWGLEASDVARDMLHWVMRSVSPHHCTAMAIKMASDGDTFVRFCCLFCLIKT